MCMCVHVCVCVCVCMCTFQTFPLLNQLIDSIALGANVTDWRTPQRHAFQCPVVTKKNHSGCVNL